ncbi:MAG TPA: penicillin-binding transpeptidase domain-containing protein, partial [Terriglobales bacterium]|nr:penicillin-binding transpeptidase domain-containing protein [Terriglobales bacterium]
MFGRDEKPSQTRLTAVQYIILAIFLVLVYGLWKLQVSQSDYYVAAAEQNRIRNVPILAPRGKILDRNGRPIVENYRSVTALLLRDSSRNLITDSDRIAAGLHMDPAEVKDKIKHFGSMPQYQPIYLKEDITPDEEAFIESHKTELPELDTIMAYRRLYPRKGFMAHLIGYVGEVSEDMLNQPEFEFYNPGDIVGKSGVELEYNDLLMGTNGSRQVLVNSHGQEVGKPLDEKPAVPGKPLKLTIDVDLQIAAEEALGDKNGAIVAMNPHNGEILAMVSRPTFDPNDFAVSISHKDWVRLVNDPEKPLLN